MVSTYVCTVKHPSMNKRELGAVGAKAGVKLVLVSKGEEEEDTDDAHANDWQRTPCTHEHA